MKRDFIQNWGPTFCLWWQNCETNLFYETPYTIGYSWWPQCLTPRHLSWINFDARLCLLSTIKTVQNDGEEFLFWKLVFGFIEKPMMSWLHTLRQNFSLCGKFDFLVLCFYTFAIWFWCFAFGSFKTFFWVLLMLSQSFNFTSGALLVFLLPAFAALQTCCPGPISLGWALNWWWWWWCDLIAVF